MMRLQHKPHHCRTPLSHTGILGSGEGDHSSPIVLFGVVDRPPYVVALRDFEDTLLFWKTTQPLGALAAAAVPKSPMALNNFVV